MDDTSTPPTDPQQPAPPPAPPAPEDVQPPPAQPPVAPPPVAPPPTTPAAAATAGAVPVKKKMPIWLIILIVLAVLGLCTCGGCTALGMWGASQADKAAEEFETAVQEAETEMEAAETEVEEALTEGEEAAESAGDDEAAGWAKVAELSGNANKRSAVFELTGAPARMKYDIKGDMVVCAVYVMPEGKNLQTEGGFPEVMVSEPGADETYLTKDAGKYYIEVQAANCDWSVVIEEER